MNIGETLIASNVENKHAAEMLAALRLLTKAEPMQQGERSGYVMGATSLAIDAARALLAKIDAESK